MSITLLITKVNIAIIEIIKKVILGVDKIIFFV